MRFIDLFAGLGGFHVALSNLGHKCVMASEIDSELASLYKKNFGIAPMGDIRTINPRRIPKHDILCAGFPCQPFSKAGDQKGLNCPQWGDLVGYVVRILESKAPALFIMENVPNLVQHDQGKTWAKIRRKLRRAQYEITEHKLSPHLFGIPQVRQRTFIVGRRGGLNGFSWPVPEQTTRLDIRTVLDRDSSDSHLLPTAFVKYLNVWQAFLKRLPKDIEIPSFPIWAMEFGATYPYVSRTPHSYNYRGIGHFHGSFGQSLSGMYPDEIRNVLPPYARETNQAFPDWKIDIIRRNRQFYRKHKDVLDPWLPRLYTFSPSFQKLEWNCKGGERDIWKYIVQFRASGIRIRCPKTAPSLVAMGISQVPVITWERRHMTPRECSRLQSIDTLKFLPADRLVSYKALGNAVNATVVEEIARNLVDAHAHKGGGEQNLKRHSRQNKRRKAHVR